MIIIDGENLSPENVMAVARDLEEVRLSGEALLKVRKSRKALMDLVDSGRKIYGVNTGFGSLLNVAIKNEDVVRLQSNLIRSHASGFGERLPDIAEVPLMNATPSFSLNEKGSIPASARASPEFLVPLPETTKPSPVIASAT